MNKENKEAMFALFDELKMEINSTEGDVKRQKNELFSAIHTAVADVDFFEMVGKFLEIQCLLYAKCLIGATWERFGKNLNWDEYGFGIVDLRKKYSNKTELALSVSRKEATIVVFVNPQKKEVRYCSCDDMNEDDFCADKARLLTDMASAMMSGVVEASELQEPLRILNKAKADFEKFYKEYAEEVRTLLKSKQAQK